MEGGKGSFVAVEASVLLVEEEECNSSGVCLCVVVGMVNVTGAARGRVEDREGDAPPRCKRP